MTFLSSHGRTYRPFLYITFGHHGHMQGLWRYRGNKSFIRLLSFLSYTLASYCRRNRALFDALYFLELFCGFLTLLLLWWSPEMDLRLALLGLL